MKQLLDPEAFNRSLVLAFNSDFDVDTSIRRVKKMIANLPPDKLYHTKRNRWIYFYKRTAGKQKCLSKSSKELYLLARRRYLLLQLQILELTGKREDNCRVTREKLILKIQELIEAYAAGNLDIARIVMTSKQYMWFTGNHNKKYISTDDAHQSTGGEYVRSKSERDILNAMHSLAVPVHYEEELSVIVQPLVDQLYYSLDEKRLLHGSLHYFRDGVCYWRVPKELDWMNSRGSVWKTYNPRTGRIHMFNDFRIMLASGEIIIWEHHGLCSDFTYRNNAGERVMILKFTRSVPRNNLIESFEHDADSPEKIAEILRREILPRLWF